MEKVTMGVAAFALALGCFCTTHAQAERVEPSGYLRGHCARVPDDDAVRNYDPSVRGATIKAFKTLAPNAKAEPDPSSFAAEARFRCMDGHAMVCFVGANLPCVKINTARARADLDASCKSVKDGEPVSAALTGHDSAYAFRCLGGKAVAVDETWKLDKRGFASEIWTTLPDD